jgi:hypothetical protein
MIIITNLMATSSYMDLLIYVRVLFVLFGNTEPAMMSIVGGSNHRVIDAPVARAFVNAEYSRTA